MSQSEGHRQPRIEASPVWLWGFVILCLALMGVIQLSGANRGLFLLLNHGVYFMGEKFWALLTFLSDGLFSFVILVPLIRRKPHLVWSVLIAAVLFTIFGQAVKHLMSVPRPPKVLDAETFHLIGPDWGHNAFPSGHASMVFNLAGVWAFTTSRRWLRIALITAALFIASARIAVGVHWPQDILAGAAIGWITIWIGLRLARKSPWGWSGIGQKILGAVLLAACVVMFVSDYTGHDNLLVEQRLIAACFFIIGLYQYLRIYGAQLPIRMDS